MATAQTQTPVTTQTYPDFQLDCGARIPLIFSATLEGPETAPIIAVFGGISAHARSHGEGGWWPKICGNGKAIDTTHYRVLSCDFLGGNGESFGPRHRLWQRQIPITTHDQARFIHAMTTELGVTSLAGFVGSSYGAMIGLALAEQYPRFCSSYVLISGGLRPSPMSAAIRALQRTMVDWSSDRKLGLILARALAMTTYRSTQEFDNRFCGDTNPLASFEYILSRGRDFADWMHPEAFQTLSHSIDVHCVDPSRIVDPIALVGVIEDRVVPFEIIQETHEAISHSKLHTIHSHFGHDAFLKEDEVISAILSSYFCQEASQC